MTGAPEPAARRSTERSRYLWSVLETLWPPPGRITRHGYGGAPGPAAGADFYVLPTEGKATLLVPAQRRGAAAALRNYKASGQLAERLQFRALGTAARLGAAGMLPHRIRIEPRSPAPAADIVGYLRDALQTDLLVSLHVGPPRANRKPVLQLITPGGRTIGFAKIGIDSLTCQLVRAEASALARLSDARLRHLEIPELVHRGTWRDHEILVQQSFPAGRPARTVAQLGPAMTELAGVGEMRRMPAAPSPYWQRLRRQLPALRQQEQAASLRQALDWAEPLARETLLSFGSWHGDWTPWNMTMTRPGRARVWDWERFEAGVPVGYDALHYHLQGAIVRGGTQAAAAAEATLAGARDILAAMGVDPATAPLVAVLYLIEIGTRYLRDGQAERGAQLGRIDSWLLPVLLRRAQLLGRPAPVTQA